MIKLVKMGLLGTAVLLLLASCTTTTRVYSEMAPSNKAAARSTNFRVLGLVKVIVNGAGQVVLDDNLRVIDEQSTGDSWREILLNKAKRTMPNAQNIIDIERTIMVRRSFAGFFGSNYFVYTGLVIIYN
jgi:hypothetical protein